MPPDILDRPRRVLVADDHPDTLELSRLMLEDVGHEVLVALDGNTAVEIAERCVPDVIFSDLRLPGMDGFALCRRLRSQSGFGKSVMFACSGLSDSLSVAAAADAGFDYYAVKPLAPDFLWNCVYAPRQDSLILLSEILIERSQELIEQGISLGNHSRIARERSRVMIERMSRLYGQDDILPPLYP